MLQGWSICRFGWTRSYVSMRLLADLYSEIVDVVNDSISWDPREPECVQRVIELIWKAGATEQRAIDAIKRAFPETIGNRFGMSV